MDDNRPAQIDVTHGGTTDISLHKTGVIEIQQNGDAPKKNEQDGNIAEHYLKMVWDWRKLITVEPAVACWLIPTLLLLVANENLQLEKSCRVNLGLDDIVCTQMINRIDEESSSPPEHHNTTIMLNVSDSLLTAAANRIVSAAELLEAETESQRVMAYINLYRSPVAQIFPIIIILFAGGWSDKKGIRKPCILFPIIGELLGCVALLISSIFMEQLPVEFGAILEKILPAMFGGHTLMIMGAYSYLTAVTTEENRTSRFGGFAIVLMILQILVLPFSGPLFVLLGYTKLFLLCIIIYCIGIVYTLFFLKEAKIKQEVKSTEGKENPTFESELNADAEQFVNENKAAQVKSIKIEDVPAAVIEEKKNFLREFFDVQLVISCIKVFIKQRENNGRIILFILVGAYFLFICPAFGEGDYLYSFARLTMKWDGPDLGFYLTYSTICGLIGTLLMTNFFTKLFKITDPMIGIVSTALSVVAKPIYAFSKITFVYYAATTVDCFLGTRTIAMKCIIARFVPSDELGRIYAVLGIMDALAPFLMPTIYSSIYIVTVDVFAGAFYLFSEVFIIPALVAFIYVYIIFKSMAKNNSIEDGLTEIDPQVPAAAANKLQHNENGAKALEQTRM